MTLLSKASIIATPTAYGDGVLNSVKPTDGAGDFDFARASSATRVNEQGLIEKERENLLLQSNSFGTLWGISNVSVTGGQSGYDGTNDAWKLQSNGGNYCRVSQTTNINSVVTNSIYAKSGNVNFIGATATNASSSDTAVFNLSTGVVSSTAGSNVINAKIESIGSGWYRCSVSSTANSSGYALWYVSDSGGAGSSSGDYVYIQDTQQEYGLVARDYIETTTSSVAVGITNDIPRINYENGIGNFLLEPQRSNALNHSEYFNGWTQLNTITTDNAAVSPEGVQNAAKLIASSGTSNKVIYQGITANTYTASVFAKKGELEGLIIATGNTGAFFNLNTQTFRADFSAPVTSYKIEDYGNGWFRYSITFTEASGNNLYIGPNDNVSTSLAITGDGTSGIYIYGATLEAGSYATSYIPSYGSAVTRAAETCNNAGNSDLFNDSEGVLMVETSSLTTTESGSERFISISNGSTANSIRLGYNGSTNTIYARIFIGGTVYTPITNTSTTITNFNKLAVRWEVDNVSLWVNGIESTPITTSGNIFGSGDLTVLEFNRGDGVEPFYGKTKMISTFKEALSDSELECLTSWSSFERMATAQNYTIQ